MHADADPDPTLRDVALLEEIDLVADLVVAASNHPGEHMTVEEIDHALGLD
ncbi:MAG: hypothetical protein V9G08_02895 [Dermatophilaceae bacterium]